MAFPVPSHLPRRGNPQDVSSQILNKIDGSKTLTAGLAFSWLTELDNTINLTKERIYDRIHTDLPNFDLQLESSKSVQTRLQSLVTNVDNLSETLSNPETGVIPNLVKALTSHASLAQNSADADVTYDVLSHLLQCRMVFRTLSSLIQEGLLPRAVDSFGDLEVLLDKPPIPLGQAEVILDLRRNFRALKDRTTEQLSDAYSRSVVISPVEIVLRPFVQIRQSKTVLPLASILSSLSPAALSAHLMTLRRDVATHIERVLQQTTSVTLLSQKSEHRLSLSPSPLASERIADRLASLSKILLFLSEHLFPFLPPCESSSFPKSLCKPLTTALLTHLLIPSLPSSFSSLPPFLNLVEEAVRFEEEYIVQTLGNSDSDKDIKTWADGLGGHYERKRRVEILDKVRVTVIGKGNEGTCKVEVEVKGREKDKASDFIEDNEPMNESGWGFDDDDAPKPSELKPEDEDVADAWGWNDEEDLEPGSESTPLPEEDSAWDPWDEPENSDNVVPSISKPPPKRAARLEKFTSKSKSMVTQGDEHPLVPLLPTSPSVPTTTPSTSYQPPIESPSPSTSQKETYLVSSRTKEIIHILESVMREYHELLSSSPFSFPASSSPGKILLQTASSSLDLWRALYPVVFATDLRTDPGKSMLFSNDCLYLSEEVERIEQAEGNEMLTGCRDALKVLGNSWFDDTIETQCQNVNAVLKGAQGFIYTAEQDRYDECENVLSRVVQEIRSLGRHWKGVLYASKYYVGLGLVVDAALSRILEEILALPDIPEVESHRLSELCRILNALEGLFAENSEQRSSVVAYVPSWLKFSYLSELLEASMADITYLFEEGALVDFEEDELVKLVRALFADTPLRTSTISKLKTSRVIGQ